MATTASSNKLQDISRESVLEAVLYAITASFGIEMTQTCSGETPAELRPFQVHRWHTYLSQGFTREKECEAFGNDARLRKDVNLWEGTATDDCRSQQHT